MIVGAVSNFQHFFFNTQSELLRCAQLPAPKSVNLEGIIVLTILGKIAEDSNILYIIFQCNIDNWCNTFIEVRENRIS